MIKNTSISRLDYNLSHQSHFNSSTYAEALKAVDVKDSANLPYVKFLKNIGFLNHSGNTVDLVKYSLFFPEMKAYFLWIPKNACTYTKNLFMQVEDEPIYANAPKKNNFHKYVTRHFGLSIPKLRTVMYDTGIKKYVVVRNPVERVISCYLDKFAFPVHRKRGFEKFALKHINKIYTLNGITANPEERSVSFLEFYLYILGQKSFAYDAHWRPQSHYFRFRKKIKDEFVIFNTNNMEALKNDLGVKSSSDNKNTSGGAKYSEDLPNTGEWMTTLPADINIDEIKNYNSFLDEGLSLHLKAFYKEDYELLKTNV